jgi:hypothetical protein
MPFFRMRKIKSHRKAAKNAREYFLYLLRLEKEYTEVTEKDRNTETPKPSYLQRLEWITMEILLSRCFRRFSVVRCTGI